MALAFAAKDPVIMKVAGVDVPKSEFEYLYNKNSQQQINPQSLEEYVEMFKLYKMKVADARAEGLDTLASFINETEQYKHDLAAPYLTDSVYINNLVQEAYDRSKEEVDAYHLMLFKTRDSKVNNELRHRADSLQKVLKGGADFAALAKEYSQDRGSSGRGGRMGWIVAGTYPYAFEIAAWNTPEGEISEVVESPVGYHILKGGAHRKARGKVTAAHILKLTRGLDAAGEAQAKAQIDSIYNLVKGNPDKFSEVATASSDDKGSARQGGMLPQFGAGEMVQEFDSVAFAMPVGTISEPFKSPFGWHIIKKIASEDIAPISAIKGRTINMMQNPSDPRFAQIRNHQTERFAKKHKANLDSKTLGMLREDVIAGGLDSTFMATWAGKNGNLTIAKVDGKKVPVKNFIKTISGINQPFGPTALEILNNNIDAYFNSLVVNAEEASLAETEPDYRNLLKEYVDGSLLYEVSVRKVWDKAAKDTEGLEKYFQAHRSNYKWDAPHAKGVLVQTVNDSVADLIKKRASELGRDTLVTTLRKEFPRQIGVDRVLVSKGTNAMVDNLMFGGPAVKPSNQNLPVYFMIDGRLLDEPEEVADVRGLVTTDYQNEFQQNWENALRRKYPVTVNEAVLRQVKRIEK